jgi:hypothetical protein
MSMSKDLVATTMIRYAPTIEANLPKRSVLFKWITKEGRVSTGDFQGQFHRMPLEFGLNTNVGWYSAAELLKMEETIAFSYADYYVKQFAGSIVVPGLEAAVTSGEDAGRNLIKAKFRNLEKSLQIMNAQAAYFDGTENDGKSYGGIVYAVPDNPATSSVGGIDPNEVDQDGRKWWQSKAFKLTSLPAAVAGGTGKDYVGPMTRGINRLAIETSDGPDRPDMVCQGSNHYIAYLEEVQGKQMFCDTKRAGMGFQNLVYAPLDVPVILDQMSPSPDKSYMLNSEYIHLKKVAGKWMSRLKDARPANQDVETDTIVGYANMAYSNRARQGVLLNA